MNDTGRSTTPAYAVGGVTVTELVRARRVCSFPEFVREVLAERMPMLLAGSAAMLERVIAAAASGERLSVFVPGRPHALDFREVPADPGEYAAWCNEHLNPETAGERAVRLAYLNERDAFPDSRRLPPPASPPLARAI